MALSLWILQHSGEIPSLLVWAAGIVLSMIYRWRNPKKFHLTLIACSLFLAQQITQFLILDWWNSLPKTNGNGYESYPTFQTAQTILTIIWILAWGILFYAIFNPKINPTELAVDSKAKAPKQNQYIWIAFSKKVRDFAVGFFGWFIFGNLVFISILMFISKLNNLMLGFLLIPALIWLPTIIASIVLFARKMNWNGTGIIAAIIANIVSWLLSGLLFDSSLWFFTLIPAPLGFLLVSLLS